ncbi:uncharacterized protein DUF4442 [Chitinophaga skermanii]|uniref:Uncharacterized protein DUF4442 n=1 Tax=Chitinophaga skermanii TaxID=331697 RepID=A0A327QKP8_9BACT|nr:DUF4442 domain-containing protein [Chitinophaga skermanii]RAJ04284.1 uncharacterized protein DUF4442 [Chitinophaga skermanii]
MNTTPSHNNLMNDAAVQRFIHTMRQKLKFNAFLFYKLPAAWLAGVRIKHIDEGRCSAAVPFKWLTQNPFKSTYFASLSMAAELSTGALAMMYAQAAKQPVSMLVTNIEASFLKKATGLTTFTCFDGELIKQTILQSLKDADAKELTIHSTGESEDGTIIATFKITWSFKPKAAKAS